MSKLITAKRKKTEADYEELAHIDFLGSLYLDENGPIIPSFVIEAMLINGAKKFNEGPSAKSGCFCVQHAKLEYEGPRTADELWKDESFHFPAIVRVGQARTPSMRVIFNDWSAIINLNIEDTLVNPIRILEWLTAAGIQCGLGDWRPQHGRFTVERLN